MWLERQETKDGHMSTSKILYVIYNYVLYSTINERAVLTFLLLLGRPSSLVLFHTARAVRSNRGAVDAGVLLLRLILVYVLALTENKRESRG